MRATTLTATWTALLIAFLATPELTARADLPSRLSDTEFWSLIEQSSEPNGYFRSDNLVSDEAIYSQVVPDLLKRKHGQGVYLGVGPEQNFTYIAALKPKMAFIVDIRRGNLQLQLLYKALFELSADRAEFVSRLFVKPRPATLRDSASGSDIITAYWNTASSDAATYQQRLNEVRDVLVNRHALPLSKDDLAGIANIYFSFYMFGPRINWSSSAGGGPWVGSSGGPGFSDLMKQKDANGHELSFLATDATFDVVKALEAKNLVVPIVGNFAGPKAVRALGQYVREHGSSVDVFYVSEVEPYLIHDGLWSQFCGNLASLPRQNDSVLIRPSLKGFVGDGLVGISPMLTSAFTADSAQFAPIADEVRGCAR